MLENMQIFCEEELRLNQMKKLIEMIELVKYYLTESKESKIWIFVIYYFQVAAAAAGNSSASSSAARNCSSASRAYSGFPATSSV